MTQHYNQTLAAAGPDTWPNPEFWFLLGVAAVLVLFAIYGFYRYQKWEHRGAIGRGGKSRQFFYAAFTLLSASALWMISEADQPFWATVSLAAAMIGSFGYLLLVNGWFRNLVLGRRFKYEGKKE